MSQRVRAGARRATRPRGDDRGSMPLALLVTIVGIGLSALLSTTVVNQVHATQRSDDRVRAVTAAQAGLDYALGAIRTSFDNKGGNRTMLPCGPFRRQVDRNNAADKARFDVTIEYFHTDPSGNQQDTSAIGDQKVACTANGTGTVPAFALLRSKGTGCWCDHNGDGTVSDSEADWRTLWATYTVNTTDENIPGGDVQVWGSSHLCLGTNVEPDDGTPLLAVDCATTPKARRYFAYPKSLQLRLTESRTDSRPQGLCVSAPAVTPETALVLKPCGDETEAAQRWKFQSDDWLYEGTTTNTTGNGMCFNLKVAGTLNTPIVLRTGADCGKDNPSQGGFRPGPNVGPGNAGIGTKQLVNGGEVGRCMDLPDDDVTGVKSKEVGEGDGVIIYPCKQVFSGLPHWNHVWTYPEVPKGETQVTGKISVTPGDADDPGYGVAYCLTSPGVNYMAVQEYVWVTPCAGASDAETNWTIYAKTPLVQDAYQVKDSLGHCMQAIEHPTAAQRRAAWTRVVVRDCNGGLYQKWNVPATMVADPLKDYGEK
jgi:hypothetical protein